MHAHLFAESVHNLNSHKILFSCHTDECTTDTQCTDKPGKPKCNTTPNPNVCVQCFDDSHCQSQDKPVCDLSNNVCIANGWYMTQVIKKLSIGFYSLYFISMPYR